MKKLIILSILLPLYINAQVTVGWDASCDYDESQVAGQIQQAITDGNAEIRVTNKQDFVTPFIINDSVLIKGGYDNCLEATIDNQSAHPSVINGMTFTQSAIKIDTSSAVRNISVENFEIKNVPSNNDKAGAITIYNSSGQIDFKQLNIHDNSSSVGGIAATHDGFFVGSVLNVNLLDVLVLNNSASFGAGGIDCLNDATASIYLTVSGDSAVSYNHSDSNGGGIRLSNCELFFSSGTSTPSAQNPLGIHANTSNKNGGGLAVLNGSVATLTGSHLAPVNITANIANLDDISSGDGGGIYVNGNTISDQSTLNASNALIGSNQSKGGIGGAIYAEFDAVANVSSDQRNCAWSQLCSLIENNTATNGGAIGIEERGQITITGTELQGNRATSGGSVAYIRDDDTGLVFEGSLIHHNGGPDHTDFSDAYLIRNSFGDNSITVAYSTVVDNQAQYASINSYNGADGNLQLFGSIIDDPSVAAVTVTPTAILGAAECNILGNDVSISNLPINNHNFETVPAFINRASQDYHLNPMLTIGIDRCENSIYSIVSVDIDGNLRAFDHPEFANDTGIFDIGVDEVEFDLIFTNGFE
jgi:hypothetical protein